MRTDKFREHASHYAAVRMKTTNPVFFEDIKAEFEAVKDACIMLSGDDLLHAQGEARFLKDLISVLEGDEQAPTDGVGISGFSPTTETRGISASAAP